MKIPHKKTNVENEAVSPENRAEASEKPVDYSANTSPTRTRTASRDCAGLRLDQALAKLFPEHSRSRLQGWIRDGRVLVDGKAASESHGGGVKGFLAGLLAFGPVSSDTIIAKAIEAGISKRSIQRAAEQMLITRTKCGFRDGWIWALPRSEGAKE